MTSSSSLTFSLSPRSSKLFSPRLGTLLFNRTCGDSAATVQLNTPTFITATSRGVVPHLSRDNARGTNAVRWINVPFESFLEHAPPVPTVQPGANPLHTFLGFTSGKHILSLSARDPADGREMPANGKGHVAVMTVRGVRKLTPVEWHSYTKRTQPDVIFALSDTPYTEPPFSQKRLTKSIERTTAWLLALISPASDKSSTNPTPLTAPVILQMAGGASPAARRVFSSTLLEPLYGPELEAARPLDIQTLDEAISGYSFNLVPLRAELNASESESGGEQLADLIRTSLEPLPQNKLRLVNCGNGVEGGPHDVLRLIGEVGVDVFDSAWAQKAADVGIALDFVFPVPLLETTEEQELGHNLYDTLYAKDFGTFASSLRGHAQDGALPICDCLACSPVIPQERIYHGIDGEAWTSPEFPFAERSSVDTAATSNLSSASSGNVSPTPVYASPFSRAYVHHLLHTHEMSAHSLLATHNISVLDKFFEGVRSVIAASESSPSIWDEEVQRFEKRYKHPVDLFESARAAWKEVDLARGKGRLAREKEKQKD